MALNANAPWGLVTATLVRFVYNDALSHSGWGATLATINIKMLKYHINLRTETYNESMLAFLNGRADLATVDVVTKLML
ncbi:MAG: hypothetical protein OSA51_00800 [Octadecabacter sp.]|nr:hypothetical protein [Octadecabacter sp.]